MVKSSKEIEDIIFDKKVEYANGCKVTAVGFAILFTDGTKIGRSMTWGRFANMLEKDWDNKGENVLSLTLKCSDSQPAI